VCVADAAFRRPLLYDDGGSQQGTGEGRPTIYANDGIITQPEDARILDSDAISQTPPSDLDALERALAIYEEIAVLSGKASAELRGNLTRGGGISVWSHNVEHYSALTRNQLRTHIGALRAGNR
jgi:hypothetical protein